MSEIEAIVERMAEASRIEGIATQMAMQAREALKLLRKKLSEEMARSGFVPLPEPDGEPSTIPMKPQGA